MTHGFNYRPAAEASLISIAATGVVVLAIFLAIGWILMRGAS
jgi:hypothetical protein